MVAFVLKIESLLSIFVITSPICNPLLYAEESIEICATYIPVSNFILEFKYGIIM